MRIRLCGVTAAIAVGCTALSPEPKTQGGPPSSVPSAVPTVAPFGISGVVVGEDDRPAGGVTVTAYLAASGAAVGSARTGGEGAFTLTATATGTINLEAVGSQESKAWLSGQTFAATESTLVLADRLRLGRTGSIAGRVVAPDAPTFKDFERIELFIPGSPYRTRPASGTGDYRFEFVAPGSFDIAGIGPGVGKGRIPGVKPGTAAPDLVLSLRSPVISSLAPGNAGPGFEIEIRGKDFGETQEEPFEVSFGPVKAADPRRLDDGTIRAVVPSSARNGDVAVTVGGIPSFNTMFFNVLKTLAFSPGSLDLLAERSATQSITAYDTAGSQIADPAAVWSSDGRYLTLEGAGPIRKITAVGVGDPVLTVSSGEVNASVIIHTYRILGVRLSAVSLKLNGKPADGSSPAPGFQARTTAALAATVTASDRDDRGVTWSTSDEALVKVFGGALEAGTASATASAIVTATSVDDPTKKATCSVTVEVDGGLEVDVR